MHFFSETINFGESSQFCEKNSAAEKKAHIVKNIPCVCRYGGFSFMTGEDSLQAKVWYNNKGYHALPAYQNAYTNTLLRSRLGEAENAEDYGNSRIC